MNTLFYDRLLWIGKTIRPVGMLVFILSKGVGCSPPHHVVRHLHFHIVPQMGISGVLGRIFSNFGNFERKTDPIIPPTNGKRIPIQLIKHQKIVTFDES